MREAIILGLAIGALFFAGGVVLTALAIKYATSSALWDDLLWVGIALMGMSLGTLALYVWTQVKGGPFFGPAILINIGICAIVGGLAWNFRKAAEPKEYDTPFVYAIPTMSGDNKLLALNAAVGARGTTRQKNTLFNFNAITTDKPRIGAGQFVVPILDPGSISTQWELEPGDYFITMRSDAGMFRESLKIEISDGAVKQTIRILNDGNTEVLKMEMP